MTLVWRQISLEDYSIAFSRKQMTIGRRIRFIQNHHIGILGLITL
jgi:hypothetical protein